MVNGMKFFRNILLIVLLGGLLGSTALAGDDALKEKIEGLLDKFDSNKDGAISEEEAGKFWKRLARADFNEDGKVTGKEMYIAWSKPPRPEPGPKPKN
jgi:hypothetical protein